MKPRRIIETESTDSPEEVASDGLTSAMRQYLAEIYRLSEREGTESGYISTSSLAYALEVSPPAVNRMVGKLRELSLLEHEPYQGIRLTNTGQTEALKTLRVHRIIEAFLVNVMNFQWHEIHSEAKEMSYEISDMLLNRMYEMAGKPKFCPHGEPIPDEEGRIEFEPDIIAVDAPLKTPVKISRVMTRETDRLQYLAALGLTPGTTFQVIHIAPFSGPIQLHIGSEYRIIGHNLAEMLRVHVE